jgi:hypothetical protein
MEQERKKLFDDEIFSHKNNFDYDYFIQNLSEVTKDMNKLKCFEFLVMIWELTKIFNQLGTSLSMAFSDITEKVNLIRNLLKNEFTDVMDFQSLIEQEIKLNIQELNGENNKDLGHKKGTRYYTYISGTRTVLRLLWFLDFMVSICNLLLTTKDSFSTCCKKAYDTALGIHHPWYVRSAASMAMSFVSSSREPVAKIVLNREKWDDESAKKIKIMHNNLEIVQKYVRDYFNEKGLQNLP